MRARRMPDPVGRSWGRAVAIGVVIGVLVLPGCGGTEYVGASVARPVSEPPPRMLSAGADTILSQDYADPEPGPYGIDDFEADWGSTKVFGVAEGRAVIVEDVVGRSLRMTHPGGSFGAGRTGVSFQRRFGDQEQVFAEWNVLLEPGWSWGTGDERGGKLGGVLLGPKLISGGRPPDGSQDGDGAGGSVRMVWEGDGELAVYVYHLDQDNEFGDKFIARVGPDGPATVPATEADIETPDGVVEWRVGRWQSVGLRVEMNTPGEADGAIDVYQDGRLVLSVRELRWRLEGTTWGVSGFMHGFFHGGGRDSYAPQTTSYSHVADIQVAVPPFDLAS